MRKNISIKCFFIEIILFMYLVCAFNAEINSTNNCLLFYCLLPWMFFSLLINLKNRELFFGLINFMNVELICAMYVYLYLQKRIIVGWRAKYAFPLLIDTGFRYFLYSEIIFLAIYFLLYKWKCVSTDQIYIRVSEYNMEIRFLEIISLCYFLIKVDLFVARNYSQNFDNFAGVLFSYGSIFACVLAFQDHKTKTAKKIDVCIFFIYGSIAFILAWMGYRTYLVAMTCAIIAIALFKKNKINIKDIGKLLIIAILAYAILIIAKSFFRGDVISAYIFSHESSIFFSLIAILKNVSPEGGANAYLNIVLSLVPSFLSGKSNFNSGAFMMQYVDPVGYSQTKISIGTSFLTEGYLSFGVMGIFIISISYALIAIFMDKQRQKFEHNFSLLCIYIYMISQLYGAMYYGAYSFVKYVFYFLIIIILLNWKKFILGYKLEYRIKGEIIE